jgi:hypothetical protein
MYCHGVYKNIAVGAVLCLMPVRNDTMCAWHVCCGAPILNQCPHWCPTYMTLFWYVLSMYWYVLVCTIIHFLYLVRTIFPEYILGTYWYVLCLQKYCSWCCFVLYACGKQYYVCVTCMQPVPEPRWKCCVKFRTTASIRTCHPEHLLGDHSDHLNSV